MSETHRKALDIFAAAILGCLLLWAFFSFFQGSAVFDLFANNPDRFQNYLLNLGAFSRLVYIAAIMTEVLVAFIPGWFVYPVGGAVFGFWQTIPLVLVGNFLGASISFWIGRKWGQPLLHKFITAKQTAKFDAFIDSKGSMAVFLLKLNPLTSLDIWNYIAGASPIKFWKFSVTNILGITPLVMLSAFFGEETFLLAPQAFAILAVLTMFYIIWFIINLPRKARNVLK